MNSYIYDSTVDAYEVYNEYGDYLGYSRTNGGPVESDAPGSNAGTTSIWSNIGNSLGSLFSGALSSAGRGVNDWVYKTVNPGTSSATNPAGAITTPKPATASTSTMTIAIIGAVAVVALITLSGSRRR